ncbi:DUF1190 domain-containing protein [Brevirhabdus sp.]|uniref:DUF1190 domain-containing protein n=1 Tax=Brevirhabdus sp. TaxID=2004514 RepID=UPI004059E9C0
MTPRRKRSRRVNLAIMGAAAFTLAACKHDTVETKVFPSVEDCKQASTGGDGSLSAAECQAAFDEALQEHRKAAPSYTDQALCEEQHGTGSCVADDRQGGGGSFFMPLLAGYMIGNLLGGGRGLASARPLYRTGGGGFSTPNGNAVFNANRGTAKVSPKAFAPVTASGIAKPMSRSAVAARGGFGATGAGRGFGG